MGKRKTSKSVGKSNLNRVIKNSRWISNGPEDEFVKGLFEKKLIDSTTTASQLRSAYSSELGHFSAQVVINHFNKIKRQLGLDGECLLNFCLIIFRITVVILVDMNQNGIAASADHDSPTPSTSRSTILPHARRNTVTSLNNSRQTSSSQSQNANLRQSSPSNSVRNAFSGLINPPRNNPQPIFARFGNQSHHAQPTSPESDAEENLTESENFIPIEPPIIHTNYPFLMSVFNDSETLVDKVIFAVAMPGSLEKPELKLNEAGTEATIHYTWVSPMHNMMELFYSMITKEEVDNEKELKAHPKVMSMVLSLKGKRPKIKVKPTAQLTVSLPFPVQTERNKWVVDGYKEHGYSIVTAEFFGFTDSYSKNEKSGIINWSSAGLPTLPNSVN